MKKSIVIFTLLVATLFSNIAVSQKDIATITQQAQSGNAEAQRELGIIYFEKDNNPKQDQPLAIYWLKKAAGQEDMIAQNYLGYIFIHGIGVESSIQQAIKWYVKAAQKGDVHSQYSLSVLYDQTRDFELSTFWLTQSARRGNPEAQVELALRYKNRGIGQGRDDTQFFYWSQESALADYGSAQYFVGDRYESGKGIPQNNILSAVWLTIALEHIKDEYNITSQKKRFTNTLTESQKKQVNALVMKYKENILNNNKLINKRLAKIKPISDPTPSEKFKLTLKKAESGDERSMVEMGLFYANGVGVDQDYLNAIKWFEKASEKENPEAQYNLAYAYSQGLGVKRDPVKAEHYYSLAAKGEGKYSLMYLGVKYRDGVGVEKDVAKARSYFERSAMQGVAIAQRSLADFYLKGIGTEQNTRKAYIWYSIACAFGDSQARFGRDDVAKEFQADELAEAQDDALALYHKIFKPESDI